MHVTLSSAHIQLIARAVLGKPFSPEQLGALGTWASMAQRLLESNPAQHYQLLVDAKLTTSDIERINNVAKGQPDFGEYHAVLTSKHLSDIGNAECFAALYAENFRFCHTRRKWLMWDDTHWRLDDVGLAYRAMINTLRSRYFAAPSLPDPHARERLARWALASENVMRIEAALRVAQRLPIFESKINDYDHHPLLAGLPNGTLNLQSGELVSARREDRITQRLAVAFNPIATCPRWQQFIHEVFKGDLDLMRYIQRAAGYSLTGMTREQKLFVCWGYGANGKSVFLDILNSIIGDYASVTPFTTFDADRRGDATNDLAALKGKRFVMALEADEDRRLAEARVKSITGGDQIACRFLHKEFFRYTPEFKLWLAVNHIPRISDTTEGMWRRIALIPFTQHFNAERADQHLRQKLRAELSGILNWILVGLRDWHNNGLGSCKAIRDATATYRSESDWVAQWLEERTEIGEGLRLASSVGYRSYLGWCTETGYTPMTLTMWGRRMAEKGFERKRNATLGKHYCGVGLFLRKGAYE